MHRAVQYIRKQAETQFSESEDTNGNKKFRYTGAGAQAAAQVLKRILTREERSKAESDADSLDEIINSNSISLFDPSSGWSSPEVIIDAAHSCLLLSPSIVLRGDGATNSTVVLVANRASLQSYAIKDKSNADDPINGRIMSRYPDSFYCNILAYEYVKNIFKVDRPPSIRSGN